METVKHTLRRPLNIEHEALVTVYYGGENRLAYGTPTPQIEIQLAILRNTESVGRYKCTPRNDHELAQMAWNMLEKDRFIANGFSIEDCIGFQLGIRSPMVGDIMGITRYDLTRLEDENRLTLVSQACEEILLMVASSGFADITREQAEHLLSTPLESRWFVANEIEKDNERNK